MLNVCCIGAGYVGGPTCAVIAYKCPDVRVAIADLNADRIFQWNSKNLPIYEPHLDEVVFATRGRNLFFTTDVEAAIEAADIIFISVNTPTKNDGIGAGFAADLAYVESAVRMIAQHSHSDKIIVEKSTVPCGTALQVKSMLVENGANGVNFEVLSNPEFLAEGTAIEDLFNPDRVVIGSDYTPSGLAARDVLVGIYSQWVHPEKIVTTSTASSELTKLAANALLAQRISSINSLSAICEAAGADINEVSRACGMDTRIGSKFLKASVGFGGSCFQKDVLNLVNLSKQFHLHDIADYWNNVVSVNDHQKKRFSENIVKTLFGSVTNKNICVFGFAFKKDTGDTRETPAIEVVRYLLDDGANVRIYDPKVSPAQIESDIISSKNHSFNNGAFLTSKVAANSITPIAGFESYSLSHAHHKMPTGFTVGSMPSSSSQDDSSTSSRTPPPHATASLLTPNPSVASSDEDYINLSSHAITKDDSRNSCQNLLKESSSLNSLTDRESHDNLPNPHRVAITSKPFMKSSSLASSVKTTNNVASKKNYKGETNDGHIVSHSTVDPKYKMLFDQNVTIMESLYEAATDSDAIVILTEWDEFNSNELNYERIFNSMRKPSYIFDGRVYLDHTKLRDIGFKVYSIGKSQ